jgi:tRNA pseudouridine38-40 synthase
MMIRNIKLTIAYDGVDYHGWQSQPGQRTIQEELEKAVSNLVGFYVRVKAASRTDAGVSALGQVVNFKIDSPIPTERLAQAITQRLPKDIEVIEATKVDDNFESSSSAKSKLYRYTIFTGKKRNVLRSRNCWNRTGRLDITAMKRAAELLIGTKDFKSFAAAADKRESSIRTVMQCRVTQEEKWIYIDIEADRFLYNMVRNIVGTLVEIGRGRWPAEKIDEILEAKDRTAAGPIAPAEGLCLMWIKY